MSAPFGIAIHQNLPDDRKVSDLGQWKFEVSPPTPHPAFADYYAEDSSSFGVVWLKGVSAQFSNDTYGNAVRTAVESLSSQLASRYGQPRKVDLLFQGSIWTEARDWTASLFQKERSYFHIWEQGKASLPEDLKTIFLGVVAYSHDDIAMIIEYASTRYDDAQQEADADLANLL
jgi:hypothetical protein